LNPINPPEMVLIDIDGTMVDSVPDLAFSIDQMLKDLNMSVRGEDSVRHWVGNGIERLVKRALVNALDGEPDEALFQRALPLFRSYYTVNNSIRSQLYDGVRRGLNYMRLSNYRMGCVTNKASEFTHPLLRDLGISDYFEVIICGDDTPKIKPDPLPLLTAAQRMQVDPQQSLMIGDSSNDVRAARAAGFQIICTSYGYNHGEDIRRYGPDAVIDSMAELEKFI
jgi:phosphoglycolate phosphatase